MLTNVPPTASDAFIARVDEQLQADRPEIALLSEGLGKGYLGWSGFQGDLTIAVTPGALLAALGLLKEGLQYDHFSFMTCSHWPETPSEAFHLVYQLHSRVTSEWVRVKCFVADGAHPSITSACGVYPAADWHECEVYDLFGIRFEEHPNLRRLLTPGMYEGFPLRRDFPLEGQPLRDFQEDLIARWNRVTDHDHKGSLDDRWVDRANQ